METNIKQTNWEDDEAIQKDSSLPISTEQLPPKRIRKRIKYYRKAVAGTPANFASPLSDENPYKINII